MEPTKTAEPHATGSGEWQELRGHVRHQAVEVLRLIAILVQDAVILLAGFLAEFAYEHWLRSEHPLFQYAISISSAVFLLLYVVTVTVHVVQYVRGQFSTTPAGVVGQFLLTRLPGRERLWIALIGALAIAVVAMAIPTLRHAREVALDAPEMRVEINTPATDQPTDFALSPDGRQIVFVASSDGASRLWLRSLAATTSQPLAGTEGANHPFWSPDSRSIGFFTADSLKRLDIGSGSGGASQTLAPVTTARGGTWNADGVIVFSPTPAGHLMRIPATGGEAMKATTLGPQQRTHVWPWFLPDGRRFLFYGQGAPDATGIYMGTLEGGGPTRLTAADSGGVYLSSGWLLWVRAGSLVAQQLDITKAALIGEPVRLADGVLGGTPTYFQSAVSVAATGLVAYRSGGNPPRQLTWVDRSGTARGTVGEPDSTISFPRVSPDGGRIVVFRTVQGNTDIWLLDGVRTSRVTFDAAFDRYPVWSPDGTRIVFRSDRTGRGDLYQKLASGAGMEERIVASDQPKVPNSWSADGRFLLYDSAEQPDVDLWVVPMVDERTPSVFLKTPFREAMGAFSPDGRWVAYYSTESGRPEIYVRPFVPPGAAGPAAERSVRLQPDQAGGQWQVSTAGGVYPAWRPDGKELYYLDPAGNMMAAPITVAGAKLTPGPPLRLFPTRILGGGVGLNAGRQYDVAPDGRFLINTVLDAATTPPITLLMNWKPDAKK